MINRQVDTRLMLFIATVLITLSHLDAFVPDPRIASGGAIGNSLFFFLSGFGVTCALKASAAAARSPSFFDYFKRRILRLYPAVLLMLGPALLANAVYHQKEFVFFKSLVWPTPFWFIPAVMLFYIPLFGIARLSPRVAILALAPLIVPYIYLYLQLDLSKFTVESENFVKIINYFCITVMGSVVAKSGIAPKATNLNIGMFLLSYLAFVVMKLTLFRFGFSEFQFVNHLLLYPIIYYSFHLFCSPKILALLSKTSARHAVYWLSGLTLEIYLVQGPWLALLENLNLDLGYTILFVIALAPIPLFAITLHRLADRLRALVVPPPPDSLRRANSTS